MWAQVIKSRAKPGKEEEIRNLPQEFEAMGGMPAFLHLFACSNQNDPTEYYTFIVFESEEAARANERTREQDRRVERMRELYEGEPEFVDLDVVYHRAQ